MSVVLTVVAQVYDWQAVQRLSDDHLIAVARQVGAARYHLYRNPHDAATALLIVEFPDHNALRQMREVLGGQIAALFACSAADNQIWEPVTCAVIGA